MGRIHINKLKPGMVLTDEVSDIRGKLLLGKGQTIQPDHFRIFKIWGVTEINVCGRNDNGKENEPEFDSEQFEEIKESTRKVFRYNDLDHPALKTIFRLSIWFRNEYRIFNQYSDAPLVEVAPVENKNEEKCAQKPTDSNMILPEMPSNVFELNEVIANPHSSAHDIAQIVQKSPSMTAILLKIANSPLYGFPSKIDSISLAVTLIGTKEISGLALGLSILSIFDKISEKIIDMFSFLNHSLACGIISRILASQKGISKTEQFFVSGLLHDLGRLILFCNYPEDSRHILNLAITRNILLHKAELNYLGFNHALIAKNLIKRWKLPISLENNVFYHHSPSEAPDLVPATLVHLADIITNGLGIGSSGERFVPPLDTVAWDRLELSPTCFDTVIKQAAHHFFALESMLKN